MVETADSASAFLADMFAASTVAPIYVASLPNTDAENEPGERHVATRDRRDIDAFVRKWDRKNRAVYFCVNPIKPGSSERSRDPIAEIAGLHADIDFKDIDLPPAEIERRLRQLPMLPSLVVASGHGYHVYWIFKEALAATPETIEQVETLLRLLADYLGADPKVAHVASFMRLPGSHNSKHGDWTEVQVVANRPLRFTLDDLEDWLTVASPLIRRKPKGNGADDSAADEPLNPWLAVAARFAHKPPIDVEARLAAMTYQGVGDSAIHATQVSVSAAMLNRGHPIDEVVEILLAATRAAAGSFSEHWNWRREERGLRRMCETWLEKHPEIAGKDRAHEAPKDEPPKTDSPKDEPPKDDNPPTVEVLWALKIEDFDMIGQRHWLHAGHYVAGEIVMTTSPGGYGKSSLVICNAIEMATGRGLIGPPPTAGPMTVGYWNAEDDADEVKRRVAAVCIRHGIDPKALTGRLFVGSRLKDGRRLASLDRKGNVVFDDKLIKEISDLITKHKIECLIFDPLVAFHGVSENDNVAMEKVIKGAFGDLATRTGCCVELVAHTRKSQQGASGELTSDDNRGAGSIVNGARSVRVLNRMSANEAEPLKITPEDRRLHLRVDRDKANLCPPAKAMWFHLANVTLPNGTPTQPGDQVQAAEAWEFPAPLDSVTTADMHWIRARVAAGHYRRDPRSPEWVGLLLIERLSLDPAEPGDRKKVSGILSIWFRNRVLAIETRNDEKRRPKEFVVPGDWDEKPDDE